MSKKTFILTNFSDATSSSVLIENIFQLIDEKKPITKTSQLLNNGNGTSPFETILAADTKFETKQHAYDTYETVENANIQYGGIVFNKIGTALKLKSISQANTEPGEHSIDMGVYQYSSINFGAPGERSVNIAYNSLASGFKSVVIGGNNNKATAESAAVYGGSSCTASGNSSALLGSTNSWALGARSVVIAGANCTAEGVSSVASGVGHFTKYFCEFLIGSYNENYAQVGVDEPFNTSNRLFAIGSGTDNSTKSTAFTVFRNGAQKWFPKALSTITNAVKGLVMMDENARIHTHDGTKWNKLAYVSELETRLFVKYTSVNGLTGVTDAVSEVLPANTFLDVGDIADGQFAFEIGQGKVDFTLQLGGVTISSLVQMGYGLGNGDILKVKMIKAGATTLKVIFSCGEASNYYEDTAFDFTTSKTFKITMLASPAEADFVNFRFGEMVLRKN